MSSPAAAYEPTAQSSGLHGLLRDAVRSSPTAVALVEGDASWTYAELDAVVGRVAAALRAQGIRSGDRVAVMLKNSALFAASALAVWSLGGAVILLTVRARQREIESSIVGFEAAAVIVEDESAAGVSRVVETVARYCRVLDRSSLSTCLGPAPATAPVTAGPGARADQVAIYQFSSGTTGRSKQVARTHRQVLAEAEFVRAGMGLSPDDRVLAVAPLYHAYGLADAFLAPLRAGAAIVFMEEFRPLELTQLLVRERITVLPSVPFAFGVLADTPDVGLGSVRVCFSAGAPLDRAIFDRFLARFGIPIRQQYGTTELGAATINRSPDPRTSWDSAGQPLTGVLVEVRDEEGRPLPAGATGEIAVRSPAQSAGYAAASDDAAAPRFRDGWFFTGDLGRIDGEGNVFVSGRKSLVISTATHKVDPSEVEQVLRDHEAVADVVVLGVPGRYGSELVKAVVVASRPLDAQELRAHASGRIADYKVPTLFEFRPVIPRSPLGKILRAEMVDDAAPPTSPAPPPSSGELEQRISRIVADVRGLPHVEAEAGLATLGVASLSAVEVTVAVQQSLGIELPLAALLANITVRQLAGRVGEVLAARGAGGAAASGALEGAEAAAPIASTPLQRRVWSLHQAIPRLHRAVVGFSNVGLNARLFAPFDLDRLRAVLARILRRHDALRARFPRGEEMVVDRAVDPEVAVFDLPGAAEDDVQAVLAGLWDRSFDLETGPLWRLGVVRVGPAEWVLAFVIHHIVIDLASVAILLEELLADYCDQPLPAPLGGARSFADYLRWHARYCATPAGEADAAYWQAQFRHAEQAALPLTSQGTMVRGRQIFSLDAELVGRLQADPLVRTGTIFEALLASFAAALHLQTGNRELLVDVPFAGRSAGFLRTVGLLVLRPFLRIAVSPDATLRELLLQVQRTVREGLAHATHSILPPTADGQLYAQFAFENVRARGPDLASMGLGVLPVGTRIAVHGIEIESMHVRPNPKVEHYPLLPELGARILGYITGRGEFVGFFSAVPSVLRGAVDETIERYRSLVAALLEAPDRKIGNV